LSRGVDGGDIITESSCQLSHPVKLKLVRGEDFPSGSGYGMG